MKLNTQVWNHLIPAFKTGSDKPASEVASAMTLEAEAKSAPMSFAARYSASRTKTNVSTRSSVDVVVDDDDGDNAVFPVFTFNLCSSGLEKNPDNSMCTKKRPNFETFLFMHDGEFALHAQTSKYVCTNVWKHWSSRTFCHHKSSGLQLKN
jgi:hypothetical protein